MSAYIVDAPAVFTGGTGPALRNGQASVSFPLESANNYARLFTQPYIVHSGSDVTGTIGAAGIFAGTFLVGESERQPAGGGFLQFARYFAEIPSGFNDFETVTYTFPAMTTYRPLQYTQTVVARVYNDFFQTANPQAITLSGATTFTNIYGWQVMELGAGALTNPNATTYSGWVGAGTELVAQQATLERYMGNIWRRQTPYVKAL